MRRLAEGASRSGGDFRAVAKAFLAQPGLLFLSLLSAERIERAFAKQDNVFGQGTIYSTAIMVWSFLGQVPRANRPWRGSSCIRRRWVVKSRLRTRATTLPRAGQAQRGRAARTERRDRGRGRKPADAKWLWQGRHAKLVDGLTLTMPDTPANQAEHPQPLSQKAGVSFPLARVCAILSLATACVMDVALGPYSAKQTGETALLRQLLDSFDEDDIVVADRYYCSFLIIALLLSRGVQVCISGAKPTSAAANTWGSPTISSPRSGRRVPPGWMKLPTPRSSTR